MHVLVILCLPLALSAALVYPPLPYPGPAGSSRARTVQTLNYPTLNYPTLTYRPLNKKEDTDNETTKYPNDVVDTHVYTLEETTIRSTAIEDSTNGLMDDTTNSVRVVNNNVKDPIDSAEVTSVIMSENNNNDMNEETNEAMVEGTTMVTMVEGTSMVTMENTIQNLPLVEATTKATVDGRTQALSKGTTKVLKEGTTNAMVESTTGAMVENMTAAMVENITSAMVETTTAAILENTTADMLEGTTKATKSTEVITTRVMVQGITNTLVENTTPSFSENTDNLIVEGTIDTIEINDTKYDEVHTTPALCAVVMTNNGLNNSSFWHGAAQGIHSLHLEEIREFFEPEAPLNNKIPVVNDDLSSEQVILFDAPLAGYDNDFKTMALKVMAHFMLNSHLGPQNMNTLEKVSHQYLMQEVYAAAAPIYKRIKENPPTDPKLCPCVKDITGNGILTELVNIVHQRKRSGSIRYPRSNDEAVNTETGSEEALSAAEQGYLADSSQNNARRLLELQPWTPNTLAGPEQWVSYEAMLTTLMLNQEELTDFSTFMFCKLNTAE